VEPESVHYQEDLLASDAQEWVVEPDPEYRHLFEYSQSAERLGL
jgi:hypothetical protein